MKAISFNFSRTVGLLAGALLVLSTARAAEADAFPTAENNYVKIGASGASLNGSTAAYQAAKQETKSGAAGIEDLSYGYDLSKDVNLQVDGKAMPGAEDYLLQFRLTKNEFGSIEAGYQRFRTFYDGAGGFFPKNNQFLPIYRRPLFVDRGKFFINATLAMPKAPVITVKYSNQTRSGRKDSTIWGDSDLTGIPIMVGPGASNPVSANRKILPAYIQLGERLETWEASLKHVVGNTTALVTVGGNRINNLNSRSIDRYVGELKPYPAFSSTTPVAAPQNVTQNPTRGADVQGFKENGITFGGKIETVLTDKVTLFAGLNHHHATESFDMSRLINVTLVTATGTQTSVAAYSNGGRPAYSYTGTGNMKMDVTTANIGLQLKPTPTLHAEVALKAEHYKDSGHVDATYIANNVVLATGASTPVLVKTPQDLKNSEKPWTPEVSVNYSGIGNLALYGSWEYRTSKQEEQPTYGALNVSTSGSTSGQLSPAITAFQDRIKETHQNVKVGANWTPTRFFTGRAEVFSKDHENRFEGYGVSTGSFYILDYDIVGTKLTGTFKPIPAVGLTARYIAQRGKAATVEDNVAKGDSNDAKRKQISGTIDWNPGKTVYVQVNGNIVYDDMVTAYPYVTGTAKDVIRNSENNYYNGDATVGFALDKDTDAQFQATYYRANNFDPAQAYATLPFGASAKEYTVTAGVKYKLSAKTVVSGKVGYIDSKNDTLGGFGDFRGPLAFVSVQHAF